MALTNADFITYGELVSAMFPDETLTTKVDALITQATTLYPDSEEMQKAWVYVTCYQQALNYWQFKLTQSSAGSVSGSRDIQAILKNLKRNLAKWLNALTSSVGVDSATVSVTTSVTL